MTQNVSLTDLEAATAAATPYQAIAKGAISSCAMVFNKSATITVYVTDDGTVPSATNGFPIAPGTGYEYPTNALPQQAVRVFSSGTDRIFSRWA
jgi:hypothetical protein